MTTKQLDTLELAEDFADWQAAKGRDHPATQEAHQKLSNELRRLHAENQQLVELSLEQAKIVGNSAERELRLMAELDKVKRITLRDEALLRQAWEFLDWFIKKEMTFGQRYTNEGQQALETHAALRERLGETK